MTELAPQLRPAVSFSRKVPVFAWDDGSALHLWRAANDKSTNQKTLPLGQGSRQWSLYEGDNDELQALWLASTVLGESALFTARIAPDLTLLRGPTTVSNLDTRDYAAAVLPSHNLLTLWVAHNLGLADTLYLQVIDAAGRPLQAIQIAKNAAHPALLVDPRGAVYVAWLEPALGNSWIVQFTTLTPDTLTVAPAVPAGLITLSAQSVLECLTMGADSAHVYLIWGEGSVIDGFAGRVQALSFAPVDPSSAVQFTIADGARWPSAASFTGGVAISLTTFRGARNAPAVAFLAPGKVLHLDQFPEVPGTMSQTVLLADSQTFTLAWSVLHDNGQTDLYETHSP